VILWAGGEQAEMVPHLRWFPSSPCKVIFIAYPLPAVCTTSSAGFL